MNRAIGPVSFFMVLIAVAATAQQVNTRSFTRRPNGIRSSRLSERASAPVPAAAQTAGEASPASDDPDEVPQLNWEAAPVDIVLQTYGNELGKTILKDPAVPSASITLKSREGQKLSKEEYLEAIEVVLEMNGVHLEPYGESFIRALPRKEVRKEGIPLIMNPETKLKESGRVVSMMIPFKHISTEEAQKALEGFKSNSGILLVFERTNSILVTDTQQNINRMLEIARVIDVASPVMENVFVRQIKYASAEEIKAALEVIVQESQKEQEKEGRKSTAAPVQSHRPSLLGSRLLGRNRPGNEPAAPAPVNNASVVMSLSDADRGMIRGKVLILSDERSNKLIIVTQKSNMDFFDKVIEQLDVETTPDTVVKVYRLKYAEAEEVSDMINDLIGNASSSKNSGKQNQNQAAKSGSGANISQRSQPAAQAKKPANQRSGEAKAGELSKDNTTVLADKRINGIVVMTQKELVPVLESIIESMDVKLSQVLIETMILQVQLSDEISTGIDWVTGLANRRRQGISGGGGKVNIGSVGVLDTAADGASMIMPGSAGAHYYAVSKALDIGAVISASKTDSRTKLVASPIIMTVDNKEATIEATKMRYLLKGYTYSGSTYNGSAVPDYQQKEIGLTVKVTPKINPNGTVMLEVEEEFSALGESQTIQAATGGTTNINGSSQQAISGIQVETTVTRKLSADITVDNRQTVILGGLTQTEIKREDSGIPILKDIPWIGRYLFGSTKDTESRQELLMFLTPYVLDDANSAVAEAGRRKATLSDARPWDDRGWSASPLADPVALKEQLKRKQREWAVQDEEHKIRLEMEKKNLERVKELTERAEKESAQRAKEAAELVDRINKAEEAAASRRLEAEVKARESNSLLKSLQGDGEEGKTEERTRAENERAKLDKSKAEKEAKK